MDRIKIALRSKLRMVGEKEGDESRSMNRLTTPDTVSTTQSCGMRLVLRTMLYRLRSSISGERGKSYYELALSDKSLPEGRVLLSKGPEAPPSSSAGGDGRWWPRSPWGGSAGRCFRWRTGKRSGLSPDGRLEPIFPQAVGGSSGALPCLQCVKGVDSLLLRRAPEPCPSPQNASNHSMARSLLFTLGGQQETVAVCPGRSSPCTNPRQNPGRH